MGNLRRLRFNRRRTANGQRRRQPHEIPGREDPPVHSAPTPRQAPSLRSETLPAASHPASLSPHDRRNRHLATHEPAIGRAPPAPEVDASDGATTKAPPGNKDEGVLGMEPMSSSADPSTSVVPPVITAQKRDRGGPTPGRLHVSIDPSVFEKSPESTPNQRDQSTADETYEEHTLEFSSSDDGADDNGSLDFSDDDASVESHQTNMSARLLLKQAQQRLHHQSVYEEVKALRAEVSRCKNSLNDALDQKLALENRCNDLEGRLAQATEVIRDYRLKESRSGERRAEREKDFMNQLNDMCATMEATEQNLMAEIIKRDQKIVDLQNLWNEEEMKRMELGRARRKAEKDLKKGLEDDGWDEDCSSEFI